MNRAFEPMLLVLKAHYLALVVDYPRFGQVGHFQKRPFPVRLEPEPGGMVVLECAD
jgi:hypothetical protein